MSGDETAVSVSDIPYPGNARAQPRPLASGVDDVRFWWCELAAGEEDVTTLAGWLSDAEHARAARYANPALARRYIAGRAALRWLLGRALGARPRDVEIERGRRGRPQLRDARLDFNVSNTRNVALVALCGTPDVRVGVDVEHRDRTLDHVGLARKFLTPRERASIAHLEADEHRRTFLRLWTCKEAMSKATGDALSAPLRRLDVAVRPELALGDGPAPYEPAHWRLAAVAVPDDYLATVALWRTPGAAR